MAKQARWQVTWRAFIQAEKNFTGRFKHSLNQLKPHRRPYPSMYNQYNTAGTDQETLQIKYIKQTRQTERERSGGNCLTWRPTCPHGPGLQKTLRRSCILYQLIQWSWQWNNDGVVHVVLLWSGFGQKKVSQVPRSIEKYAPILKTCGPHVISTALYLCRSVYFRLTSLLQESAANTSNSMPSDYLGHFLFILNIIYKY